MFGKIWKSAALLGILAFPGTALGQSGDAGDGAGAQATKVLFSQPFAAKKLGNLTLPFGWDVEEAAGGARVVATEARVAAPAVLTVDLLAVPKGVEAGAAIQEIARLLAEKLGAKADVKSRTEKPDCGKAKCPSITVYTAEFAGKETAGGKAVDRRCAIEIIPAGGNLLAFTICTDARQKYDPDLADILHQTLMQME